MSFRVTGDPRFITSRFFDEKKDCPENKSISRNSGHSSPSPAPIVIPNKSSTKVKTNFSSSETSLCAE